MSNEVSTQKAPSAVATFSKLLERMKPQMALALPKHMSADRMARLALTPWEAIGFYATVAIGLVASVAIVAGASRWIYQTFFN